MQYWHGYIEIVGWNLFWDYFFKIDIDAQVIVKISLAKSTKNITIHCFQKV